MIPIKSTAEMMREARHSSRTAVTCMHPGFLYNCLQDLRPITLVDLRTKDEYDQMHVRDAYFMDGAGDLASLPVNDRVMFMDKDSELMENCAFAAFIEAARSSYSKVYFLKGGFAAFAAQYPFLCVSSDCTVDDLLRARARFPTEILSKQVYLGGIVHLCNLRQLQSLGIHTVIDCGSGVKADLPLAEVHLTFNPEDVDFETAIASIENSEKAVLLYDLRGDDLAASIAAVYFSHVKGLKTEHALAYVVSKRPEVSLRPDLFLQLQNFRKTGSAASLSDVLSRLTRGS